MCRFLPFDKEMMKKAEPGSNLFIKGLRPEWTHRELYTMFRKYGEVLSARVSLKENFESRRYGFILYSRGIDAQKAISELNGK
jgi:polyadenylate-binding protein